MARAIIVLYVEFDSTASEQARQEWIKNLPNDIHSANFARRVVASDKTDDAKPYAEQAIVDLQDLSTFNDQIIHSIRAKSNAMVAHSDWHIYREISRDFRSGVGPNDYPPNGTELIQVGMAPTPEAVQSYHDWFDQEHLQMLADIPGWRSGSRYQWSSSIGDGKEIAWPFMSSNEYEVENGLGGPIWQKSMDTPWTVQVLANLSKPNHRRTWKYVPLE